MSATLRIDPVTRIEGHLAVKLEVHAGKISQAYCLGEMFRGFEVILRGRDPLDAQQITQRICGVCPISHGTASVMAQEEAYGVTPTKNGRLVRNLMLAANYLQSHILHFYHLAAIDFIDITAVLKYTGADPGMRALKTWVQAEVNSNSTVPAAPFLPRYEAQYLQDADLNNAAIRNYLLALDVRAVAHEMVAIWGGKAPHATALVPGGVTECVTADKIAAYASRLERVSCFINDCYIPDVLAVAQAIPDYFGIGAGCGNYMSYGVFPEDGDKVRNLLPAGLLRNNRLEKFDHGKVAEHVRYSFFKSQSGLHPSRGSTEPALDKSSDAYSWLKAPRYDGEPVEVGPLARMLVAYHSGQNPDVKLLLDDVLAKLGAGPEVLNSVLGRHAARALEAKIVADRCHEWLNQLRPGEPAFADFDIPESGRGMGLTEAPRGALGHWIDIKDYRIANYQCVVPTTWNCSPRDDDGRPGPVEQALAGVPIDDQDNPIEAARIVRSFDPCLACAVH